MRKKPTPPAETLTEAELENDRFAAPEIPRANALTETEPITSRFEVPDPQPNDVELWLHEVDLVVWWDRLPADYKAKAREMCGGGDHKQTPKVRIPALTWESRNRYVAAVSRAVASGSMPSASARALLYAAQLVTPKQAQPKTERPSTGFRATR